MQSVALLHTSRIMFRRCIWRNTEYVMYHYLVCLNWTLFREQFHILSIMFIIIYYAVYNRMWYNLIVTQNDVIIWNYMMIIIFNKLNIILAYVFLLTMHSINFAWEPKESGSEQQMKRFYNPKWYILYHLNVS